MRFLLKCTLACPAQSPDREKVTDYDVATPAIVARFPADEIKGGAWNWMAFMSEGTRHYLK